jgi:hypothetical protein
MGWGPVSDLHHQPQWQLTVFALKYSARPDALPPAAVACRTRGPSRRESVYDWGLAKLGAQAIDERRSLSSIVSCARSTALDVYPAPVSSSVADTLVSTTEQL